MGVAGGVGERRTPRRGVVHFPDSCRPDSPGGRGSRDPRSYGVAIGERRTPRRWRHALHGTPPALPALTPNAWQRRETGRSPEAGSAGASPSKTVAGLRVARGLAPQHLRHSEARRSLALQNRHPESRSPALRAVRPGHHGARQVTVPASLPATTRPGPSALSTRTRPPVCRQHSRRPAASST